MLTALRRIALTVFIVAMLVLCAALALALHALESQPRARQSAPADYATMAAGKALVKRIKIQVESADERGTTLTITEQELDALAQMGAHTFAWLYADVEIDGSAINVYTTLRLPANPFGNYLNLGARVAPGGNGIGIDRLSIGPLEVSGRWLLPLAAGVADALLREKQASRLLGSVRALRIAGDTALITVTPPPDVTANLKQAVRTLQAYRFPPGEEERTIHYYELLAGLGAAGGGRAQSLSAYMTPLMREAQKRREDSSAVTENRAAIWALAIYFSNGAIETLIGKLVSGQRALVQSPSAVTLAGRGDLKDHFVYSAGVTLATQQGIGVAVGEFKELLDSGNGGSGFSFADLAADRAGIAFVMTATESEDAARRLQDVLGNANGEHSFFPDISGLAEGLGDEQFRQRYGDVRSPRYQQQVELIDQRIARLPIYRSSGR